MRTARASRLQWHTSRRRRQAILLVLSVGDTGVPFSYVHDLAVWRPYPYNLVPVTVTPGKLKDISHNTIVVHDPLTNSDETYSGVTVTNLFTKLGTPLTGKEVVQPIGFVAAGLEHVTFSLATPDSGLPEEALIADSVNGHPIDQFFPFRLVVTRARCPALLIHNLNRIEFKFKLN